MLCPEAFVFLVAKHVKFVNHQIEIRFFQTPERSLLLGEAPRIWIYYPNVPPVFVRMSLDLATSPLSGSLANIPSLESGPIALAANGDKKPDDSGADVKPFTDTNQKTSTAIMKRVQSDAMLNMAEEAGKTYASSQQNSCQEDFLEEVLNRLGTATISDSSYVDEDAMKKVCCSHIPVSTAVKGIMDLIMQCPSRLRMQEYLFWIFKDWHGFHD